jgi:hypothetical protein
VITDVDNNPPLLSDREDCENPSACPCSLDGPCQHPLLQARIPEVRPELEPPPRG